MAATVPDRPDPTIELIRPTAAALVLGSTTPEPRAPGDVPVVRRRSGGGAVLVEPGRLLWVDLVIPRLDPRWEDDVGRAALWAGEAWSDALEAIGLDALLQRGPSSPDTLSSRFCFAGLGPGELSIGGRKVMGVAQRRTRHGARLQTTALLDWRPRETVRAFGLSPEDPEGVASALTERARGVGRASGPALEAALLASLAGR